MNVQDPTPPPPIDLTREEKRQVQQRLRPRAAVMHETIRVEGEHELHRPASALAWSGLAAGLSMGFSLVAMGLLRAALPDAPWRPLLVNFGYSMGFLIVIVGRQQLFTENSLTPVLPLLHNRDRATLLRVLRLWGVVLAANVAGALLFATAAARAGVFRPEVREAFQAIGLEAMEGSFASHFVRAIFSGWLIALLVWLLPSAETARIFIIVAITYLIGIAGLSHIIAGSVEALYDVIEGQVTWTAYVVRFFVPVLLGNVLGGASLVGALTHAQITADAGEDDGNNGSQAN